MAEEQVNEALEKLNQGIRKTRQMAQVQTIELAQEYFVDSIEMLDQQVKESRAALEDLPKKLPWGQEESFQILFQELVENYAAIERSLAEAGKNAADLDTEQLRKQGELKITAAARREARKRGVDLGKVEGTGSEGRILVDDVRRACEEAKHEAAGEEEAGEEPEASDSAGGEPDEPGTDPEEVEGPGFGGIISGNGTREEGELSLQTSESENGEEPNVTRAARRRAEELGVVLTEVEGTGSGGIITMSDILKKT